MRAKSLKQLCPALYINDSSCSWLQGRWLILPSNCQRKSFWVSESRPRRTSRFFSFNLTESNNCAVKSPVLTNLWFKFIITVSSVARGGGGARAPPIGLWSMQNRTFLVLLRPIFCEKLKTAPPKENSTPWNVWISDFGRKISLNFGEDLFFFFFFGDHLILGGKNVWISELSEKFCLKFRANRVKLIQEQWKFGSRSFALFSLFQKSPPFSKSWLPAWLQ